MVLPQKVFCATALYFRRKEKTPYSQCFDNYSKYISWRYCNLSCRPLFLDEEFISLVKVTTTATNVCKVDQKKKRQMYPNVLSATTDYFTPQLVYLILQVLSVEKSYQFKEQDYNKDFYYKWSTVCLSVCTGSSNAQMCIVFHMKI